MKALSLCLLLALVACSGTGPTPDEEMETPTAIPTPVQSVSYATPLPHLTSTQRMYASLAAMQAMAFATHEQTDWREVGKKMSQAISSAPEGQETLYREAAANHFLFWFQTHSCLHPEALDAVGEHTVVLVDVGSSSFDLVLAALRALDGHWTDQQIRATAAQAAETGDTYLRDARETYEPMAQRTVSEERIEVTAQVISALRDLAE